MTSTNHVNTIETHDLSKFYGAVAAVRNVNFTLNYGDVVGLLGDNGAGKTTLIRLISGSEAPTSGKILVNGESVRMKSAKDAMKNGIETIHQYNSVVGTMSISQNIFLGREILKFRIGNFGILDFAGMRAASRASLRDVGFHLRSQDAVVSELSGGQRQGVAIARALHFKSRIMILDEPTNHLSIKEANNVIEFIKSLPSHGFCGVFASHNLPHIFASCTRIVVMARGKIVADAPTESMSIGMIEDLL